MPTEGMPAARVRGVTHRYPGGVEALRGFDLDLGRGEVTALLGANGSGKTTLLRILAGTLPPTVGDLELLGRPRGAWPERDLRRRIGYLSQTPALDPEMRAGETLDLLAVLQGLGRPERRARLPDLAEAFGLDPYLSRPIAKLSGGLERRLHLAAGMVHDPELLLLDEPTAGLDDEGRRFLWAELERRAESGAAVAIITHDLAAAERHAGKAVVLESGEIAAAGPPVELIAKSGANDLAEVYRRLTGRDVAELEPGKKRGRRGLRGQRGQR